MDKKEKISEIVRFVSSFPASTASLTIVRRHADYHYNPAEEYIYKDKLKENLKNNLKSEQGDEIDFCYYLIK